MMKKVLIPSLLLASLLILFFIFNGKEQVKFDYTEIVLDNNSTIEAKYLEFSSALDIDCNYHFDQGSDLDNANLPQWLRKYNYFRPHSKAGRIPFDPEIYDESASLLEEIRKDWATKNFEPQQANESYPGKLTGIIFFKQKGNEYVITRGTLGEAATGKLSKYQNNQLLYYYSRSNEVDLSLISGLISNDDGLAKLKASEHGYYLYPDDPTKLELEDLPGAQSK